MDTTITKYLRCSILKTKKDSITYISGRISLGGITVISSWGTFDSKRGGSKSIFCNNQLEVKQLLQNIKKTRLKRGYIIY